MVQMNLMNKAKIDPTIEVIRSVDNTNIRQSHESPIMVQESLCGAQSVDLED